MVHHIQPIHYCIGPVLMLLGFHLRPLGGNLRAILVLSGLILVPVALGRWAFDLAIAHPNCVTAGVEQQFCTGRENSFPPFDAAFIAFLAMIANVVALLAWALCATVVLAIRYVIRSLDDTTEPTS